MAAALDRLLAELAMLQAKRRAAHPAVAAFLPLTLCPLPPVSTRSLNNRLRTGRGTKMMVQGITRRVKVSRSRGMK
jgi:hypothetical protein